LRRGAPGDGTGFAEALVRLYEDPALRESLGRAARRRVEDFYLYDREGERMQEIYRFALGPAMDEDMTYAAFLWGWCGAACSPAL